MDFETVLNLIVEHAPNTPVAEALVLAEVIVENSASPTANGETKEQRIIKWVADNYSVDYLKLNDRTKIEAIKAARMHLGCSLKEAMDAVKWYVDHPDPMHW